MRNRIAVVSALFGLIVPAAALGAPEADTALERISWLVGCWQGTQGGREIEEQWTAPRGGVMLGTGRTLEAGKVVAFEYMRITSDGGRLVYHASPGGRGETAFEATDVTGEAAVFSNPEHGDPSVIRYSRLADGSVLATVEGVALGRPHATDFAFRRVACDVAVAPAARPAAAAIGSPQLVTRQVIESGRVLDGVPCRRGDVFLHDNGRLAGCHLWGDHRIGETLLPYGSDVAFDEAGNLRSAYLRETTAVQGHACKGRGKLYPALFYPNGKLASCSLERDEEIRGVPCAGAGVVDDMMGKGPETQFRDDGSLKSCEASRDATVAGRPYRKGDRIEIAPGGGR